jgi:hypothetical protein
MKILVALRTAKHIKPELLFGIGVVSGRTDPSSSSCACYLKKKSLKLSL